MSIEYRQATAQDVPSLKELIPLSARALSQGYYSDREIESAITHVFGVDSQLIADGTYYVAVTEGRIVGCGGWSKHKTLFGGDQMKGAEDDLLDPARDAAKIRAFFVHPEFARRGIGRSVMERCEAGARAQGFTRMEMGATLPGEPLYAAVGYSAAERIDYEMPDGVTLPIIHMIKTIA